MRDKFYDIFLMRVVERFILTGLVLIIALVVMIAFWRSVQKIEFSFSKEKLGAGVATVLATPVLVLLVLVGFSWVVLTNPIDLKYGGSPSEENAHKTVQGIELHGVNPEEGSNVNDTLITFNCAISRLALVTDREKDVIARVKANYILAHWESRFGDKEKFWAWAVENGNDAPSGEVSALLNDRGTSCLGSR